MPRSKKEIDKELMYKKIMPSARTAERETDDEDSAPRAPQRNAAPQGDRFAGKQLDQLAENVRKRAAELESDDDMPAPLTPRNEQAPLEGELDEPEADDDTQPAQRSTLQERFAGAQLDKLAASVHKRATELEDGAAETLPPAAHGILANSDEAELPRGKPPRPDEQAAPHMPNEAQQAAQPTYNTPQDESGPFDMQPAYNAPPDEAWPSRAPTHSEGAMPFPFTQPNAEMAPDTELMLDPPSPKLMNIMEVLVAQHIDDAITKFRCCQCDKCHKDIVAIALNQLQPHYVVIDELESPLISDRKTVTEVMTALVRAVLSVKAKPRH